MYVGWLAGWLAGWIRLWLGRPGGSLDSRWAMSWALADLPCGWVSLGQGKAFGTPVIDRNNSCNGLFWSRDSLAFVNIIHSSNWWHLIGANRKQIINQLLAMLLKSISCLHLLIPLLKLLPARICFSYYQKSAQPLWFNWSSHHYSQRCGHDHKVKEMLQSRSQRGWFRTWSLLTWHLVRAFVWLESTGEGCNQQNLRPECSGDIWWTVPFIVKEYANCYVGLFLMSAFLPWSY